MVFGFIFDLWNKWNIRGLVILSFTLQVFLILFAPLTKKTTNYSIFFLVWLAYLMADWVAAFTIGLISHNQGNSSAHIAEVDGALQAFWTSILLLHLGGPDTIIAFALEDSSLWGRHLLSLIFQVGASIYVFVQIFTSDKSMATPTMLVFLAAVIKNVERIPALNLSSFQRLRKSMISQMDDGLSKILCDECDEALIVLGDGYTDEEARLAESIVVKHAYYFFQIFKVFLGDLIFTRKKREISRTYFRKISAIDALRVISVELHFVYEVLRTKALATHSKLSYMFRFIAFTSIVVAFIMFNRFKKHRLFKLDVKITYILLFGWIALDVIALFRLVFSDWTVAKIMGYKRRSSKQDSFLRELVSTMDYLRKPRFATYKVEPNANVSYEVIDTPFIFRRWSESISACNIFYEILEDSSRKMYKSHQHWGIIAFSKICSFTFCMSKKIISCFHQAAKTIVRGCGLKNRELMFVSKNPFIKKLWIFIFKEVKRRSENTDDPIEVRKIYEARGDMFLNNSSLERDDCDNLLRYVIDVNYDTSIIMWHVATEMWYYQEKQLMSDIARDEREFSKILSDYMMYLLLQTNVVSSVAGIALKRLEDTLADLHSIPNANMDVERLSQVLFEFPPFKPRPRSVLCDGIDLANRMKRLGEMKWKVMSGVWGEMLFFAASHIKGTARVQVLSKGGELITFVWLLMAHLGCFFDPDWGLYYEPQNKSSAWEFS